MVTAGWLAKSELFEGLEENRLESLLADSKIHSFSPEETIFQQGEEATHLYVLIHGSIELTVKAEEKSDLMSSKVEKEGAVFGTASLMEPFRYNVSAICLQSSKVLILNAHLIRKRMEEDPFMGMRIMRKLASIYFNRLNALRAGVSNLLKILKGKTILGR